MKRSLLALALVASATMASAATNASHAATTTPDPVIFVGGFAGGPEGGIPMALRFQSVGVELHTIAGARDSGTGDIGVGAQDLAVLVDQVLAETGATKVDLIGFSMGGLTARQYVKFEGGASKVDDLITVASPNYGTNRAGLAMLLDCAGIVACTQMAPGSDFLNALNEPDDTYGTVTYTTFRSLWDEVVVPIDNAKLQDGATNVLIQDQCPFRFVEHFGATADGAIFDGILDVLAKKPVQLNCWAF